MTMQIKEVKGQVEWCLQHFPVTQEDDTSLVMSVWKNFHREAYCDFIYRGLLILDIPRPQELSDSMSEKTFGDLPSFESIRRVRQKLNEQGYYLPSDEVMKQRGRKVKEVQEDLREMEGEK